MKGFDTEAPFRELDGRRLAYTGSYSLVVGLM